MKTINSLRSKLFALTLALMASVASFAYDEMPPDFKVDGLYYNFLEGDNVEVTHPYRPALPTESASNAATQDSPDDYANLTELTIPSTVTYEGNVYHVTRIGHHAFDQCENLTSVDIPNSIKSIGIRAFSWCSALTSIVLKGGLENIESYAFEYCLGLENISSPNSLMTIGQNAFYNTQWYKNQPNGGVYVGNVFYKYKGDIPQNTSFVIKEGTVSISPYAFVKENYHEDYSLVSVSIPNSVKVIGEGVFYRCRALTSIVIPDGVTTIETLAFHYCKALNSVTCKAVEPPVLGSSVFSVVPLTDATLYVPAESVDAYKNADQWKDFGQILPIEPTSYKSQWCDTWNMFVENGSVYPPHEETYRYQLAKDTVIGDYTYTAIVSKAINDALDAPHYVAAVRFTDDRKVYIYYDNAEYLLYDFNVQQGDELEVFAGINNYTSEIKTYKCTVTGVEQYACVGCPATITLEVHNHPDDFREFYRQTQWIEGVGDINGFLNGINGYINIPGNAAEYLLCAYQGDELKYTGDLYEEYGCGDDAEQTPEDLFPTLWGLQRTEVEYHTDGADAPSLVSFEEYTPTLVNGKWYLYDGMNYLREENNQVLLYSPHFEIYKDIVLYDWTLEVGDTLPYYFDKSAYKGAYYVVTNVSTITLLDGKEYKKWTLACGIEYIEGIGAINGEGFGNYFCIQHTAHPATYIDTRLVCASRNGQLLYQMDEAEMERLGAECLCDYTPTIKDNAKNGKIGGRPTPTQWYVLDIETKDMGDPRPTVLRAETFSYTLENDSIVVNGRTFYQLACQSTKDTATTKSVVGALHFSEDKGNRVYFLRDGVEYLLYDFTAEPGDTIEIFAGINNYPQETTYTHVVADKDTTEDGACRMFLEVVFPEETTTVENAEKVWLAGLGSIDGIVHNTAKRASIARSSETQTSIMLCAWREDDCLYTTNHPDYNTLGCVYNIDETTAVDDIHTSPSYQKLLREGQLLIIHEGKTYNVMGVAIE